MARDIAFAEFKGRFLDSSNHTTTSEGWIVFAGYDVRGYGVFVQRATHEKQTMVRVGCRYKTLRQAMKHWGRRARGQNGKRILTLIQNGLNIACYHRHMKRRHFPEFFDTKLRR